MNLSPEQSDSISQFCSMIEWVARATDNTREDVMYALSAEDIGDILNSPWFTDASDKERADGFLARYKTEKGDHAHSDLYLASFDCHEIGEIYALLAHSHRLDDYRAEGLPAFLKEILDKPMGDLFRKMQDRENTDG